MLIKLSAMTPSPTNRRMPSAATDAFTSGRLSRPELGRLRVIPRVLDQTTAGLHQALLQAGQQPILDLFRQHQPPHRFPRF